MSKSSKLTTAETEQRYMELTASFRTGDHDPKFRSNCEAIKKLFISDFEALCRFTARLSMRETELIQEIEDLGEMVSRARLHADTLADDNNISWALKQALAESFVKTHPNDPMVLMHLRAMDIIKRASNRGKNAAESRHGKANGTRAKKQKMRELWATGKFANRNLCAEEECAAVGMAYTTARRALIGTPDPIRPLKRDDKG